MTLLVHTDDLRGLLYRSLDIHNIMKPESVFHNNVRKKPVECCNFKNNKRLQPSESCKLCQIHKKTIR